jgi:hypothetical protein
MIIRGGGATGVGGLAGVAPGAALCICVTLLGAAADAGGAPPACAAGGATRGGTAIAGGAALADAAAVVAAGGVTGALGGITTTDGGRYVAATEAGVTILGGGAVVCEVSEEGFGEPACGAVEAAGLAFFASAAEVETGGFAAPRDAGASAVPFCWVMARSTSPGREIFDRSILVLMPSSPLALREVLAELGAASERPRRCFRTKSASWSSRELECVFFSVTPTVVSTSRISLLLTSNSRAKSLIRILLIRLSCPLLHR